MAQGPFLTRPVQTVWNYTTGGGTITGGTKLRAQSLPITDPDVCEWLPGLGAAGTFQPGNQRRGMRYFHLPGCVYELRPQPDATTPTPEYELFMAAGFAQTNPAGLGIQTLGDPHIDGGTPDGVTEPLGQSGDAKFFGYIIDTQIHEAQNVICDLSFDFIAGGIPTITADFWGQMPSTVASVTATNRFTCTRPAVGSAAVYPAPWLGATVALSPASTTGDIICRSIRIALNNEISVRPDANNAFGVAPFVISGRAPSGVLVAEMCQDTFNAMVYLETPEALTFHSGVASGSGARWDVAMGIRFTGGKQISDEGGKAVYALNFEQNPDGQALKFAWT